MIAKTIKLLLGAFFMLSFMQSQAAEERRDFHLGPGDSIHVAVFRSPELTLDTRVGEDGTINFPMVGLVRVGGGTITEGEMHIAKALKDGGFVQNPQVNITVVTVRGSLVSVLGQVTRPGLYPLDTPNLRLSEILAVAGGVAQSGGDRVIVKGVRNGQPFRKEINLSGIFVDNKENDDIIIRERDEIYVPLAPMFYIYGEVQKPGSGVIVRDMTVIQALAQAGGLTPRGTERNIELRRRLPNGQTQKSHPEMTDKIEPDDVLYVHESLF
ncbi:MAG TPA: polysaccharide export protein EpsE [Noviherbaspirillum sp.]